jgi:REP element-mobilizing transposase RayT
LSAAIPPECGSPKLFDPEGVVAKNWLLFQTSSGDIRMGSTYLSFHFHLVFSTKNRVPYIDQDWQTSLHEYLGGTLRGLGGFPEGIGGVADHVHLLFGLKATHTFADVVRELKKASSVWVHEEIGLQSFAWQDGYAAFTVSATARADVKRYIANQEEHHRTKTFREELIEMLQRAGVEYDPKYLD